MVSCMVVEYLLDGYEMNELLSAFDGVNPSGFKKIMEETFSAQDQEEAGAFLVPKFDEVAPRKEHFTLPVNEQINDALARLEEGAEEELATQCVSIDGFGEILVPAFLRHLDPFPKDSDVLKSFGSRARARRCCYMWAPRPRRGRCPSATFSPRSSRAPP